MKKNSQPYSDSKHPITAVWCNGGRSASYDSFVAGLIAILQLNFCTRNPSLHQATNRYWQDYETQTDRETVDKFRPIMTDLTH